MAIAGDNPTICYQIEVMEIAGIRKILKQP
jgi:hypothetical protein